MHDHCPGVIVNLRALESNSVVRMVFDVVTRPILWNIYDTRRCCAKRVLKFLWLAPDKIETFHGLENPENSH